MQVIEFEDPKIICTLHSLFFIRTSIGLYSIKKPLFPSKNLPESFSSSCCFSIMHLNIEFSEINFFCTWKIIYGPKYSWNYSCRNHVPKKS